MTRWEDQRAVLPEAACIGVYRSADGGKREGEWAKETENTKVKGETQT